MKEKKNKGARKVLLMAISVALVAAVSVSATLAYLTAKSNVRDNRFVATGNITGEILEPSFDEDEDFIYVPGKEVPKDPLIDNDTAASDIYVGAKLTFKIDVGNGYQDVSYAIFKAFVDITGWDETNWVDLSKDTDAARYYFYKNLLTKDAAQDGSDNYDEGKDNTTKLFTTVTPKPSIQIAADGTSNSLTTAGPQGTYAKFDFKIIITGYGVEKDAAGTVTDETAQNIVDTGLRAL